MSTISRLSSQSRKRSPSGSARCAYSLSSTIGCHSLRRVSKRRNSYSVAPTKMRQVDGLQLRFLARLAQHRPEAPRLFLDLAIRAEHADRQRRHRDHHADDHDDDQDLEQREAAGRGRGRGRARSLRLPVAPVGVDTFAAFLAVGAERVDVVLAVLAGIDVDVVVLPRDP